MNQAPMGIRFNAPPLAYLTDEQLKRMHRASIAILEKTGSVIRHHPTLKLLQKNGVRVGDNQTAYIPENLVNWAVEQAPESVMVFNRAGLPAMDLRDAHVYFGTGPDCQYVLDRKTGEPRDFNLEEMKKALVLADALPQINFVMSMAQAGELENHSSFLKKYLTMVTHTTKPLVIISGPELSTLERIVEMASFLRGGRSRLTECPSFLLLVDPTSPLVHTQDALEKLAYMARNRLPVIYAPGIMAGATSPVTIAGAIAQANAEILAGLVVHQLTLPGSPFIFGGGMSPLDMKSGQPTYSAPEAMISQAGLCQLGRELYRLPTWGFGGCSASKICDEQAAVEASNYLMISSWMGSNLVHDIGYLEFGMTYSLELLTICDEIIGQIRRMMCGIEVSEQQLALEAIHRVGPGGDFLTDPHTLQHYRENWQPDLIDRRTRASWQKQQATTLMERARKKIDRILSLHQPEQLSEEDLLKLNQMVTSV